MYTTISLLIYSGLTALAVFLIGVSVIFRAFNFAYFSLQPLKNLVQSPLLVLILISGFLILNLQGPEKKNPQ